MFWPSFAFSPILRLTPLVCMTSVLSFVWTSVRSRSFVLDLMVSLLPFVSKLHRFYNESCWAPAPLIGYPIFFSGGPSYGRRRSRSYSLLKKKTPKTKKHFLGSNTSLSRGQASFSHSFDQEFEDPQGVSHRETRASPRVRATICKTLVMSNDVP